MPFVGLIVTAMGNVVCSCKHYFQLSLPPSLPPRSRKRKKKAVTPSDSESESESDDDGDSGAGEGVWVEKKAKGDTSEAFVGPVPEIRVQALGKLE